MEVAAGVHSHRDPVRLFAAADRARTETPPSGSRRRRNTGPLSRASCEKRSATIPYATARAEGAELATDDALEWARRSLGPRQRPPGDWGSLTIAQPRLPADQRRAPARRRARVGAVTNSPYHPAGVLAIRARLTMAPWTQRAGRPAAISTNPTATSAGTGKGESLVRSRMVGPRGHVEVEVLRWRYRGDRRPGEAVRLLRVWVPPCTRLSVLARADTTLVSTGSRAARGADRPRAPGGGARLSRAQEPRDRRAACRQPGDRQDPCQPRVVKVHARDRAELVVFAHGARLGRPGDRARVYLRGRPPEPEPVACGAEEAAGGPSRHRGDAHRWCSGDHAQVPDGPAAQLAHDGVHEPLLVAHLAVGDRVDQAALALRAARPSSRRSCPARAGTTRSRRSPARCGAGGPPPGRGGPASSRARGTRRSRRA